MNYAAIKTNDIANGPGVRVSLFVSGCRHHCKNCFNSEAWDFSYGAPFTDKTKESLFVALDHDHISGLSILGGEPFEPENQGELLKLTEEFRKRFPQKSIWCFTGFLFEDIISGKAGNMTTAIDLLNRIDVLIDGKFVEAEKSPSLLFRGSANQRILDVKLSLIEKKPIWLPGKWQRTMGNGNIEED